MHLQIYAHCMEYLDDGKPSTQHRILMYSVTRSADFILPTDIREKLKKMLLKDYLH